VESIPADKEIIFVPDKNLGRYAAEKAKRDLILWPGYCPTHQRILAEDILEQKEQHPNAEVIVHPECTKDVIALADGVESTSGILRYCRESDAGEFVIGSELGLLHRLQKENPPKRFHAASKRADCPNMKLNNIEKMVWSLEEMIYRVEVPSEIAERARGAIEKMLELG